MKKYNKNKSFKYKGINIPLEERKGVYLINKMIEGQRVRQSLGTSDFETAKQVATRLIQARLNPDAAIPVKQKRKASSCTLRELWDRLENCASMKFSKDTLRSYKSGMINLVHWALGIDRDKVLDQRASILTKKLVVDAQNNIIKSAKGKKLVVDNKSESMNTYYRCARSWFGRKVLSREIYAGLILPDLTGFISVPKLTVIKKDKYKLPDTEVMTKIVEGLPQLRIDFPRAWIAGRVCMETGMRKEEALQATFGDFGKRGEDGQSIIRVESTEDHVLKGTGEGREIPVVDGFKEELQKLHLEKGWPCTDKDLIIPKGSKSSFHGNQFTSVDAPASSFNETMSNGRETRGDRGFRALSAYMVECGWTRKQKAHELRKVYASWACAQFGPYAVKQLMGHRHLSTTERYAAKPKVGVTEVGVQYGSAS
jgi:integrase